jgi:hypothetical protein
MLLPSGVLRLPFRRGAPGRTRLCTTLAALVVVCTALISAVPASAAPAAAGKVRFVKNANRSFDRYTLAPSLSTRAFFQSKYSLMLVNTPYFDSRLRWYKRGWVYLDLYGIPARSSVARRHPGWILRGKRNRKLFIPFACRSGRCDQYAGDPTNPAFRRWWIRNAKKVMKKGYRGLYLDNVNLIRRVALSNNKEVVPRSLRSKRRISNALWRRTIARFTRQIRRAMPRARIAHNVIWFAPGAKGKWGRMQTRSANVITLERGVNDAGLTGGTFTFGLRTFLRYSDWVHRRKASVMFLETVATPGRRDYGLAGYFMVNNGRDTYGTVAQSDPSNWWPGFEVNLGAPKGKRYLWKGLLRRDFQRGMVLMNEPGGPARSAALPRTLETADRSRQMSSVALSPGDGAVLVDPR